MKTKAEVIFDEELSYIDDNELRRFVLDVFNVFTPEYFWTVPCSTTGKYHPKVSLGPGGLIRHTKLAVWWGLEIMQCWAGLAETAVGEVTAALLIHDLNKNGDKLDARGFPTLKNASEVHGPYLGNKICCWINGKVGQDTAKNVYECQERIDRVVSAVMGHMGIWTHSSYEFLKPQYLVRENDPLIYDVCHIVHLADYVSSRKVDDFIGTLQYDPNKYNEMFTAQKSQLVDEDSNSTT